MVSQRNSTVFKMKRFVMTAVITAASVLTLASTVTAATLRVTVENLAPQGGTFFTPLWFGFHDGTFDTFNEGESIPTEQFERLVEDGLTAPISELFDSSGAGSAQGTIFGGPARPIAPIAPGQVASVTLDVNENLASSRYFSYASMVIPSNDAFFANDDSREHRLFDDQGNFIATSFEILGSEVLDAGTEVNDETTQNTAFFGQAQPNTGIPENGVVRTHPGFFPQGSGGILDDPRFTNANFKAPGYRIARISIEKVPEPSTTAALLPLGGLFLLYTQVRRWQTKKA